LYFWDSTCGHCKKETPRLKEFYDEYKDKGVEIVALTLENEFTGWKKYIQENDLDWINGFESDFDRPNFLWYYYIPTTPKKLVLGPDKSIIAKNLDVETTLRTFIDDYLAGKVK
jgi:thiol-disulfide isomerase/thioredoxin